MQKFIDDLAKNYKYKKLPDKLSEEVRKKYLEDLDNYLLTSLNGDNDVYIYTSENVLIARGYDRVVIGDYGAFIEIDKKDMIHINIKVKEGQEYRYEERYKTCKYYWLTAKDNSNVKIYQQKGTVSYADYLVGKFYVSPYEVKVEEIEICHSCSNYNCSCTCE